MSFDKIFVSDILTEYIFKSSIFVKSVVKTFFEAFLGASTVQTVQKHAWMWYCGMPPVNSP